MFGPDVSASITPGELRQLVEGAHLISNALASPVDKSTIAPELGTMREMFGRSVAPRRRLAAGTVLTSDDLTLKKPGTGISGERLPTLVGRTLLRSVEPDELLRDEDLA
jgi:N-acetylneuraminate synthase